MSCFRPPKKKAGSPRNQQKSPKAAAKAPAPAPAKAVPAGPSVPENILKKTQRDAKLLKHMADQRAAAKAARAVARKAAAASATAYAAEYAAEDKKIIDAKRAAKKNGDFYVDAQAKIAFVVRTRG